MQIVDFNALFKKHLLQLLKQGYSADKLEDEIAELYIDWSNTKLDELNTTPIKYLQALKPSELVGQLLLCFKQDIQPSDALLDAMVDEPDCAPLLLSILRGEYGAFNNPKQMLMAKRCAGELLNQYPEQRAINEYIKLIKECDSITDIAEQGLQNAIGQALESIIEAIDGANDEAKDCLLGIVARCKDERVFAELIKGLNRNIGKCGYYAHLLELHADERALEALHHHSKCCDTYFDYKSVCEAIEALGGEVLEEISFNGDRDFEIVNQAKGGQLTWE